MTTEATEAATGAATEAVATSRWKIFAVRAMHGAISVFFLSCMAYIYYAGLAQAWHPWILAFAIGALAVEGAVVVLNDGVCPLGAVHERVGDDSTFFELFLPKTAARLAVPVLGLTTVLGVLLVLIAILSHRG